MDLQESMVSLVLWVQRDQKDPLVPLEGTELRDPLDPPEGKEPPVNLGHLVTLAGRGHRDKMENQELME